MIEKRILVVDDSPVIRDLVQILLTDKGYNVDEARDGLEAVALIEKVTYDLIVSDIQMPHLDGMGVLEEANRLQPEAPVILMSGALVIDPEEIRDRGAFAYIEKPFGVGAFVAEIELCLEASAPETTPIGPAG